MLIQAMNYEISRMKDEELIMYISFILAKLLCIA
jgi:hypothetical protein